MNIHEETIVYPMEGPRMHLDCGRSDLHIGFFIGLQTQDITIIHYLITDIYMYMQETSDQMFIFQRRYGSQIDNVLYNKTVLFCADMKIQSAD